MIRDDELLASLKNAASSCRWEGKSLHAHTIDKAIERIKYLEEVIKRPRATDEDIERAAESFG